MRFIITGINKEQINYSKFYFSFFRTFAPIFHFKLCSFCYRSAEGYIFLTPVAGYPSYATG